MKRDPANIADVIWQRLLAVLCFLCETGVDVYKNDLDKEGNDCQVLCLPTEKRTYRFDPDLPLLVTEDKAREYLETLSRKRHDSAAEVQTTTDSDPKTRHVFLVVLDELQRLDEHVPPTTVSTTTTTAATTPTTTTTTTAETTTTTTTTATGGARLALRFARQMQLSCRKIALILPLATGIRPGHVAGGADGWDEHAHRRWGICDA